MLNRYRIGGILVLIILLTLISCGQNGRRAEDGVTAHAVSSDLVRTDEHEDITWDLIQMAEHDPALKAMLEESVAQAYRMNPDPDTNPVSDLESYYAFLDRCYLCLPWEIHPVGKFSSLYDQIDQGMGCLYYVCNQPLKELEDKGYYHNSLMYHEPFRSWFIQFLSGSGAFLNTEASWCEEYYRTALANRIFIWTTAPMRVRRTGRASTTSLREG